MFNFKKIIAASIILLTGCFLMVSEVRADIKKELFGKMPDGREVDIFTVTNKNGVEVRIMSYGGIIVSIKVPDKQGRTGDVVLGFDNLEGYLKGHPYFGAIVGRYGNRIGNARFSLNGVEYKLAANNDQNHLHGGLTGFDKVIWAAKIDGKTLELSYLSRDGEEGYPGNLSVKVHYTLTDRNELKIDYFATTDKDTVVNLTNHSYFNLAGQGSGDILKHRLEIGASSFTPVDSGMITTGEIKKVVGTPFDFLKPTEIGARVDADDQQLKFGRGYDHNWVIDGKPGTLRLAARVYEPSSGRQMEVRTTEPGVQFYIGNFLDGTLKGKDNKVYQFRYGFCLETQHFPDSPNKSSFPSTVLRKGASYKTTTIYKFSVK